MTSILNSCTPNFEGLVISFRNKMQHDTTTPNKRQASANTGPQVKTFIAHNFVDDDRDAVEDSGLEALEAPSPREAPAPSPSPATTALKSSNEMLRSILSPPSAASIFSPTALTTYEELKKSTASTYEDLKAEAFSSTMSRTASPSSIFSSSYTNHASRSKGAASPSSPPPTPSRATKKAEEAAARTKAKVEKEKSEGQSLLSRSQARRMKLQQCYSEIMKNASPTSIKEQHEQYQQLLQRQQEGRDDETASNLHATIKSPRVRALYDFDLPKDEHQDGNNNDEDDQQVEEYTPTHQPSNEVEPTHNPPKEVDDWEAAEVRRGRRTCALDLTEIEQFTQDVRERIQQCSSRVDCYDGKKNDEKNKKPKNFQEMVKEFEEEWKIQEPKKTSNLSHSDIKKKKKEMMTASSSISEDTTEAAATVATRWKALQAKPQALGKKGVRDDELEAWWKERQQSAKKPLSASKKFDQWWESQKENKNKELVGRGVSGSTATVFQELEGEPTVEVNVASKVSFAAPSKQPNDVASGTLKVVLSRVDEAKKQFVKALEDNDVKRQSELAALLAQLGEAAAAMRKLGQMS